MRNLFFLVVALFTLVPNAFSDDSLIIRRAYLDTIGVVPTVHEIEWYCIYNKNSYETAIDWLINQHPNYKWNIPKDQAKLFLMSDTYKEQPKRQLSQEDVNKILLYVSGYKDSPVTEENIKKASIQLIKNALNPDLQNYDPLDYIANCLMSRSTNITEANLISQILKQSNKSELDTWLCVLNELLKFEDVATK